MPDDCNLCTFPSSEYEALAMLYLKSQNLTGKSVQDIAEIYYNTYYEFRYNTKDIKDKARNKFRSH